MTIDHVRPDLEAINARAENATGGPWSVRITDDRRWAAVVTGSDGREIARCSDDDIAEFIAAARTDVPVLVAEVRRLTAIVEAVEKRLTEFARRIDNEHHDSDGQCVTCRDWTDGPAEWPCASAEALTAALSSSVPLAAEVERLTGVVDEQALLATPSSSRPLVAPSDGEGR